MCPFPTEHTRVRARTHTHTHTHTHLVQRDAPLDDLTRRLEQAHALIPECAAEFRQRLGRSTHGVGE